MKNDPFLTRRKGKKEQHQNGTPYRLRWLYHTHTDNHLTPRGGKEKGKEGEKKKKAKVSHHHSYNTNFPQLTVAMAKKEKKKKKRKGFHA